MEKPVKVHRWDEVRARSKPPVPLEVVFDGRLDVGDGGPDAQRKAVQRAAGLRWGKRIRGCSTLVSGGFVLVVDPVEPYPLTA